MSAQDYLTYHTADESGGVQLHQAKQMRAMWAEVVLAALDDAMKENRSYGNGTAAIARWARSRDGQEVLSNAGIDPSERVITGLQEFVERGIATSEALARRSTKTE